MKKIKTLSIIIIFLSFISIVSSQEPANITCNTWSEYWCENRLLTFQRTCFVNDDQIMEYSSKSVLCCDDSDCLETEECQDHLCVLTYCKKKFNGCVGKKNIYIITCGNETSVIDNPVMCCNNNDCPSGICIENICQSERQKCIPLIQVKKFGVCKFVLSEAIEFVVQFLMGVIR